tara:strand:- start:154 stop:588 length:435 start_codon:yes stop_codon:yes gene_type:complete
MKLETIYEHWSSDSKIDRTELGNESIKIPQLHAKYFKFYSEERLRLKQYESEYKILYKRKFEYYMGTMDEGEQKNLGWEPQLLKILRTDLPTYIDADQDIINLNLKISMQKEKIDVLDNIIRTINNRGFQIKNVIDWEKFKTGQ